MTSNSHMGVDLQTHLAYTADLHDGRSLVIRWDGVPRDEPVFTVIDTGDLMSLPPTICKSFELRTVVNS
ncbi:MAG: hypothetical protein WKF96_03360 [Solirubrobacteraceae bacterium]